MSQNPQLKEAHQLNQEEKSQEAPKKESSNPQLSIPKLIQIDFTPQVYQKIKRDIIAQQHPVVRPHIEEYFKWLRNLHPLDVYDAIEKGETVKDRYEKMRWNPIRMSIAAARGLLKISKGLRDKAEKAVNLEVARLTLRFENPSVWEVLKQFDPQEEHLKKNIESAKEILGLIPPQEKTA